MKDNIGEEEIGNLNMNAEEAKNALYNENNNPGSFLEKDKDDKLSNRYTMVDNNFEDDSRENSLGLNKQRESSNAHFNEEMNQNGNAINDSNTASKRVSRQSNKINKNLIELKIILVGDSAVGKTSIVRRYINGSFEEEYNCTIQAECRTKLINEDDNTAVSLNFWDTVGQEKYRAITRQFYRDCQGAFVVFDITSKKSFEEVQNWIKDVKSNGDNDTIIIILGNKSDLADSREVYEEEIKNLLNNDYLYYDVSAKNGTNISLAFDKLKKLIMEKQKNKEEKDEIIKEVKVPKKKLNDKELKHNQSYKDSGKDKSSKCC